MLKSRIPRIEDYRVRTISEPRFIEEKVREYSMKLEIFLTELLFEILATNLCIKMRGTKRRCKSWLTEVLSTAPKAKLSTAKATATPRRPSCPVAVYLLPKNASSLEQAVAESLSQQKTQRAAPRDHGVNTMTLGEACKRALYVATNARRF